MRQVTEPVGLTEVPRVANFLGAVVAVVSVAWVAVAGVAGVRAIVPVVAVVAVDLGVLRRGLGVGELNESWGVSDAGS